MTDKETIKDVLLCSLFILIGIMIVIYIYLNMHVKNNYSNNLKTYQNYMAQDNINTPMIIPETIIQNSTPINEIDESIKLKNVYYSKIKKRLISNYKTNFKKLIIDSINSR